MCTLSKAALRSRSAVATSSSCAFAKSSMKAWVQAAASADDPLDATSYGAQAFILPCQASMAGFLDRSQARTSAHMSATGLCPLPPVLGMRAMVT